MEKNCNHDCMSCETCMHINTKDTLVPLTSMKEQNITKFYCKEQQMYVALDWYCEKYFGKPFIIVTDKGIQRTRGNKHNVNNQ